MKIVVACSGVVSAYTMTSNIEMLTEELDIKNVHIEEWDPAEVKAEKADLFVAPLKEKEQLENAAGMIILLNNTMDKQEITLKLLEALNELGIITE